MVQILDAPESFGSNFARGLGSGLTKSAESYMKQKQQQRLLQQLEGDYGAPQSQQIAQQLSPEQKEQTFLEMLPEVERLKGRELTPKDLDTLWSKMDDIVGGGQQSQQQTGQAQGMQGEQPDMADRSLRRARAEDILGLEGQSKISAAEAGIHEKRNALQQKQSFAREKAGEPKLQELENKLEMHELEGMEFDRLANLFSPENDEKFPPSFLVGALTKDGELTALAQSQLSDEAQEAVKIVTNQIRGAKDSFGSQVTNFDAQTYLKTLPSLLNSPGGRRRVLRDLRLINELNKQHAQGVLDIMDRYGGPSKMSLSKAERMYKKEFAPQIKQIRQEFINPEATEFKDFPSASLYPNREVKDEETGQIFVSDGKEWRPK